MAPNRSGEALLDLCTSAMALGNTLAVHTLEYLSIAKNPRAGIKECAVEFLEASRALFPAKVSLERSPAQFSPDITQELRDRFRQTKSIFFILDQTINKLLSNEKAHGFGKRVVSDLIRARPHGASHDTHAGRDHKMIEQLLDSGAQPLPGPLTGAILHQDLEAARLLLLYGASANAADGSGRTPLYAATATTLDAAHLLLKHGADPNISSEPHAETPLAASLSNSKWSFAQLYLQHGADANALMRNNETAFTQAINKGMPSAILELLLLYDAKPDGKNGKGETPLFKAINAERLDVVTLLLDSGADPNLPGPKIMLWPAVHRPPILQVLLERGADLRRAPGVLELATSINSRKAIDLLLKHDADPNAKKDGIYTPLCSAIRDDHEDLVALLLAKGADPNLTALACPTFECVTYHRSHILPRILAAGANPHEPKGIIEHCVAHNELTCLRYLLTNCRVDPNARSPSGATALTTALRHNLPETVDILLSHGADPAVRGGGAWPVDLAVHHPPLLAKLLPHIDVTRINKGAVEQAVVADQLESVKLLLAKGVSVQDKTAGVFSPLTTSIREKRKEIFRFLVDDAGADPNTPGEHLPIIKAIRRHREDDMSYIEHLIAKGADINLIYRGWNAVLQAVDNGDVKILRLLASKGKPDLSARDESGRSVHEILEERGLVEEERILKGEREEGGVARERVGESPVGSQGIVVRRDSPLMGREVGGR
ncbi:ankyrin [Teratosphaeria nubilosa]|uniref:Ankyrin n=1 Tax=Teratosphaeria nubilosa TaxID=161662 RepID=A0A6G1LL72_9PEZI|nr:ankyrin [Teratosphaeria nubilosa]